MNEYVVKLSKNIDFEKNGGYLICKNVELSRSGVQEYNEKDLGISIYRKPVKVYRLEEDIFNEDSINSLVGRPITLGHPHINVTSENYSSLSKGEVISARRDGNRIVGDLRITDKNTIDLITEGKMRAVSVGFEPKIEEDKSKGIYKFKNIIYNHLALVSKGRDKYALICDQEREKTNDMGIEEITQMISNLESKINKLEKKEEPIEKPEPAKEPQVVSQPAHIEEQIIDEEPLAKIDLNPKKRELPYEERMQAYYDKFHRENYATQADYEKAVGNDLTIKKKYSDLCREEIVKNYN